MRFKVAGCEICKRYLPAEQINYFEIDFFKTWEIKVVNQWYCGVRIVCDKCIEEIKKVDFTKPHLEGPEYTL